MSVPVLGLGRERVFSVAGWHFRNHAQSSLISGTEQERQAGHFGLALLLYYMEAPHTHSCDLNFSKGRRVGTWEESWYVEPRTWSVEYYVCSNQILALQVSHHKKTPMPSSLMFCFASSQLSVSYDRKRKQNCIDSVKPSFNVLLRRPHGWKLLRKNNVGVFKSLESPHLYFLFVIFLRLFLFLDVLLRSHWIKDYLPNAFIILLHIRRRPQGFHW